MKVFPVSPRGFAANCYLVTQDGENAVAIDPATPSVLQEATARGLRVQAALLTHGHFDHVGGADALRKAGARVGCLAAEQPLAERHNLAFELGEYDEFPPVNIDFTFEDGEVLELAGMRFRVLATPGHTAGSCCFCTDICCFTGDTLFAGGVGRCDLPTGNASMMRQSLKRLFDLGDLPVYPGHGPMTTLAKEAARC